MAPSTWRRVAAGIATDLLVVEYWTPLVAPALRTILARSAARRRLLVCHNALPHEPVGGARMLLESLLRRADGVIVHSEAVRAALRLRSDVATRVVPLPLLSSPDGALRCPVELARDVAGGADLVVLVGHLRRYKGLGVLERAWRSVGSKSLRARLVVAGEPIGVRRELEALATCAEDVTLIPRYLDDAEVRWLLANAAAVVLPYTAASQS
ncbi:MAG: glycosyltransferase, partial [Myxococcota bacterium]